MIMGAEKQQENITVQIVDNFKDTDACPSHLRKLVKAVCNRFRLSNATINIALTNDAEIRRLNEQFLNRKSTTDCLSFNLSDEQAGSAKLLEIAVNAEKAVREANLRGHSSEAELALYITHGLLHNLGFDDSAPAPAKKMHNIEDEILQQAGYGLVYNKSTKGL